MNYYLPEPIRISDDISLGDGSLTVIAGPCSIESRDLLMRTGETLAAIQSKNSLKVIFKSSFDKANRTSLHSFRSSGMSKGLELMAEVKAQFGFPLITDIHEVHQVKPTAEVVDVLQIPAFLCRQTDLLVEAGQSGLPVNIKKGQFLSPHSMREAIAKVNGESRNLAFSTERGTTFGYGDLVVDYRSLPIMRQFSPIVFDATHSVQQPGALGDRSGGNRSMVGHLARAAVAVGVDGVFMETHPNPDEALSDGPNMVPTSELEDLLKRLLEIHHGLA